MSNFDLKAYMDITPEIEEAVRTGKPVVALESTILSHGMPYPENLSFARDVEKIIREQGAIPATMAIIDGRLKCGLTEEELVRMCEAKGVLKVSRRDLPIVVAQKLTGATTVATTMILANMAGIHVFATGGIGGVHRHGEVTMDVSADLQELAHTPVAVICAGAKMILDIGRTLEYLETMGVPVLGLNTDDFPAFYCRKSGFGVDCNAKTPADVAAIAKAKWGMGLQGGMLIGNPVPEEYAMDFDKMSAVIDKAMAMADEAGVKGKNITPFLLAHIVELTGGDSLKTNIQLAFNNARAAAQIAVELAKLRQHIQNDIGHAEGNVRQDKRYIPKLHLHGDKEQHQRNARDDFRVDDRQIGDIEHQGAYDFFHVVNADGSERAEHGGKRGGNQSNDYGVEQGAQNGFVMKELYIPIQRKSRPYRAAFGLIEGVCDQNADGGIQKQEYQKEIEI